MKAVKVLLQLAAALAAAAGIVYACINLYALLEKKCACSGSCPLEKLKQKAKQADLKGKAKGCIPWCAPSDFADVSEERTSCFKRKLCHRTPKQRAAAEEFADYAD